MRLSESKRLRPMSSVEVFESPATERSAPSTYRHLSHPAGVHSVQTPSSAIWSRGSPRDLLGTGSARRSEADLGGEGRLEGGVGRRECSQFVKVSTTALPLSIETAAGNLTVRAPEAHPRSPGADGAKGSRRALIGDSSLGLKALRAPHGPEVQVTFLEPTESS
jgi:hypothetical protein